MKFAIIKNRVVFLGSLVLCFAQVALPSATPTEIKNKRVECGKKIAAVLASCLCQIDNKLTFFHYIQLWRNIIQEYKSYFDESIVKAASDTLAAIDGYVRGQKDKGKPVESKIVAALLKKLTQNLPKDVENQLNATFRELQMKLLKRTKPLNDFGLFYRLTERLQITG